jgi:uncharacterized membrane protein YphA (DoxX/SURF4 family)
MTPSSATQRRGAPTSSRPRPQSRTPESLRENATQGSRPGAPGPGGRPVVGSGFLSRAGSLVEDWAPTAARLMLGLVLAWFGYHELVSPGLWTGYVPVISSTSHLSELLVLTHGWLLLVLAVSLVAGVAPRLAALVASVLLLEIVISLSASGGLSDLVLRDVGVLGLCVSVIGAKRQHLLLGR